MIEAPPRSAADYAGFSFWLATAGDDLTPRPALEGDIDVDVAIVGAGYTGLWTAYYLTQRDPTTRIALVEAEIAGFGASGRNGGWCSALFAASKTRIALAAGRDGAIALQRAMFETVDEVGRAAQAEGIDAHYAKGGTFVVATAPAHVERLKREVAEERSWGLGPDDVEWLDRREAQARLNVEGNLGAVYTPHCAALHPARLVRGLARAVERRGVRIYEQTRALALDRGRLRTTRGTIRADVVVRATEAYTRSLPGLRRALVPLYSLMIVTEPLPQSFWDEVGWRRRETFTDGRHLLIYAQRTADDRVAIGGRGAPYHFGSRIEDAYDREPQVFDELHKVLVALFPSASSAAITHRWGGPIGAPRDWFSSVGFDRATGTAWAGGYIGDGVSTSNLAGRTLADLIHGDETDITHLPWVNRRSRPWEPEPFRWIGANLALRAMASADRVEARTGEPARRAELVGRLIGR